MTRVEDGWHVRNGYTFEQLETLLEENGFEPVDRLRFGTPARHSSPGFSTESFGRWIDPLTVVFFPVLKLLGDAAVSLAGPTHDLCAGAKEGEVPARARVAPVDHIALKFVD